MASSDGLAGGDHASNRLDDAYSQIHVENAKANEQSESMYEFDDDRIDPETLDIEGDQDNDMFQENVDPDRENDHQDELNEKPVISLAFAQDRDGSPLLDACGGQISEKDIPSAGKTARQSGLNGFRIFAKQYRADHPDECKQSVAAVSKIIGAAWKGLSDIERAKWNSSASKAAASESGNIGQLKHASRALTLGSNLQFSRVKGIMQLDPEIHHISKEAVEFVRSGAEMFIKHMCHIGSKYCGSRHSIQYNDFKQMIKTEHSFKFLLGAFNKNNASIGPSSIGVSTTSKRARASPSNEGSLPPSKSSKITSFFKKA